MNYKLVMSTNESTVVSEYNPEKRTRTQFQSEAELENEMVKQLQSQGYEYLEIHKSEELEKNMRSCLERLNDYTFSDKEWDRFFHSNLVNGSEGIKEKTRKIQQDYIQVLVKDDGFSKNIKLIEKENVFKNHLQVIRQYEASGKYDNRYDVTILVNGFPLVHCELKRRGIPIKEAFNQIDRYQRDSFWADSGLYEYIQIFVISNGTDTKYYSNSTRFDICEDGENKRRKRTESTAFEFTNHWADSKNKNIKDLVDFTKTFFSKQTLLNILTRYCIFTVDETLMVMRPYQIIATEKILQQLLIADNYKRWGSVEAGGYIWHTTGSGKTLTSFKTSQLASQMDDVDKVLFVVDRQDLDYQTMKEYEKFQRGAVNGNKSTKELENQLGNDEAKIIVTTIQKLGIFCKRNESHPIFNKKVVLIFDECHRSQFGATHKLITKKFKKYAIFGFTGTPIFAENAKSGGSPDFRTTEQVFGQRLHTYTVVNAINDNNVLPFKIDYVNTVKENKGDLTLIEAIDDEKILLAPERVSNIVSYILRNYSIKTNKKAFNSIFATSSIDAAKLFYSEFERQQKDDKNKLKIALIYSYAPNGDNIEDFLDEDSDGTDCLKVDDRIFLDKVIDDYNKTFNTQYDSGTRFGNYYKNISERMKNKEIDILIVVNMFLTGFDAKTLGALWVDKNLKMHGLIQAFSRTNRIYNSTKHHGNIICFRNLKQQVDEAISLFGDEEAKGVVILKTFDEYYLGYEENGHHIKGYVDLFAELQMRFPLPVDFLGNNTKKEFVKLMSSILRVQNILRSFDEFNGKELFEEIDLQDYLSVYNDLHDEFKTSKTKEDVVDDIVFEMELVKQVVVDIDYIIELIAKHNKSRGKDKVIPLDIQKAISSNPSLRPKRELIESFLMTLNSEDDVQQKWEEFKAEERVKAIDKMIQEGVNGKPLNAEKTRNLIEKIFRAGVFRYPFIPSESDIAELLPAGLSYFGGRRNLAKSEIKEKLNKLFDIYYD